MALSTGRDSRCPASGTTRAPPDGHVRPFAVYKHVSMDGLASPCSTRTLLDASEDALVLRVIDPLTLCYCHASAPLRPCFYTVLRHIIDTHVTQGRTVWLYRPPGAWAGCRYATGHGQPVLTSGHVRTTVCLRFLSGASSKSRSHSTMATSSSRPRSSSACR